MPKNLRTRQSLALPNVNAKKVPLRFAAHSEGRDPLYLLLEEHLEILNLFREFVKSRDIGEREKIAERIFWRLETHAKLEDNMLYPKVERYLGEEGEELVHESRKEHQRIDELIEELRELPMEDRDTVKRMQELQELTEHHFFEEESETFVSARNILAAKRESIGAKLERLKRKIDEERSRTA